MAERLNIARFRGSGMSFGPAYELRLRTAASSVAKNSFEEFNDASQADHDSPGRAGRTSHALIEAAERAKARIVRVFDGLPRRIGDSAHANANDGKMTKGGIQNGIVQAQAI
jgi:hypothetical protein